MVEPTFPRKKRDDIVFETTKTNALAICLCFLTCLDLASQTTRQRSASSSDRRINAPRCIIMTGDKAPKSAVRHNRERSGGDHTHVLEILYVNGRNATQNSIAHIQWRRVAPGRLQRRGHIR